MRSDEERWAEWEQAGRLTGRATGLLAKGFLIGFLGFFGVITVITVLFMLGLLILMLIGAAL